MPDVTEPLRGREKAVVRALQVGLILGLLAAWHYATATKAVSSLMLPPMQDVALQFLGILKAGTFWGDLAVTLDEIIWSFLVASVLGIALGFALSRRRLDVLVFEPILAGLYAIPVIVIYPLYVLFFGLGPNSKIALGATIAFFPIALSTMTGFAGVPRGLLNASRVMGASNWKTFRYVLLPAAFPLIIAGLRIGFILAFLSIIGGEMLASYRGLGRLIIDQAEAMNTGRMYAYIVFLLVLSLALNALLFAGETWLGRRPRH
jgi:ABC-type nitrate/sulfonate/bicarbonate transport system permease component